MNIFFFILLLVIALVGISLLPLPNNYKIYSVSTGSMEPVLKVGSLIVVKPQKDYHKNDIVTAKTKDPKNTVTHRIVNVLRSGTNVAFETKGDANNSKDFSAVLKNDIIGKVIFSIPFLGFPISYSKTLPGLIFMIIIPSTIIIYSELINIKNEAIKLISEKRKRKLNALETVEEQIGEQIVMAEKKLKKKTKKKFRNRK